MEDAIAIRQLRDIDQAERLLVVRRKKRIKQQQEPSTSELSGAGSDERSGSTIHLTGQDARGAAQRLSWRLKRFSWSLRLRRSLCSWSINLKMQLEDLKGRYGVAEQQIESGVKQNLEKEKEDRKDSRIEKQAVQQSKLISQRKGDRPELKEED